MDPTRGDPLVGRRFDGRYAIESFIAHGGMASVYLATDTRLERRVAVKVMHAHLADDADTAARFQREARAAARLSHPDVVAVYDQGTDDGQAFLVMEYVPGANLRHIMRDRGPLPPGQALAVMDHILAALGSAHRAGLIHRDVKPENILITADGRVKVADFGLARALSGSTLTTTGTVLLGTAAYLAPEQFEDGIASERSDVYSAGIVLFEMLTGTTPFTADSAFALLRRHASEDVPAPSTRTAGIPPQVDALVTWATSRDPLQRPADADEFHASLVDVRDRLGLHEGVPGLPVALTTRLNAPTMAGTPGVTQAIAQGTQVYGGGNNGADEGDTADQVPRGPRRRGPFLLLAIVLVVIAAAVLGWWFAAGRYTHAPGVVSLTKSAAIAKLKDAGLHARVASPVHSAKIPQGLVARESPGSGDRIGHGGTVTLRLSLGPVTHPVPLVQGDSITDAINSLKTVDLHVAKTVHRFSDTVPKGAVVGTNPGANQSANAGSGVTLIVSKGQQMLPVPAVKGDSLHDATVALKTAGFVVAHTEANSDSIPAGDVISADPAHGKAPKGSTVTLSVSKGPQLFPVPNVTGMPLNQAIQQINAAGFKAVPRAFASGGPGTVLKEVPNTPQPKGAPIELDYY